MSCKVKGVGFMDGKARLKHQTLVQEFMDLQEETDVMRNKLEAAKQRKLTLAAEVRFLRRRYKFLLETKEQERKLVILPSSLKQTKSKNEKPMTSKEYNHHRLPPKPEPKLKKRRHLGEEVATPSTSNPRQKKKLYSGKDTDRLSLTPVSVLNYSGRVNGSQGKIVWKTPTFDLNQSGKCANDTTAYRKPYVSLDLNQDSSCSRKEASSQTRAPIFDLNEISTGDEDFQYNAGSTKLVEAKKSLMRGLNDEQQNDLNLPICRNSGDSSSLGKRKISWQDPVALRV